MAGIKTYLFIWYYWLSRLAGRLWIFLVTIAWKINGKHCYYHTHIAIMMLLSVSVVELFNQWAYPRSSSSVTLKLTTLSRSGIMVEVLNTTYLYDNMH